MTDAVLTNAESLVDLKSRLFNAERLAAAEQAFDAAAGRKSKNPWEGKGAELDSLRHKIADAERAEAGRVLRSALQRLRGLDTELEAASRERERADRIVAELAQDPSVMRFKGAYQFCMRRGWAHSWTLYTPWFLSGKALYQNFPQGASYFLNIECPSELRFTDAERAKVIEWNNARGLAEKNLIIWCALAEQRSLLLRERPELAAAS